MERRKGEAVHLHKFSQVGAHGSRRYSNAGLQADSQINRTVIGTYVRIVGDCS